MDDRYFEDYKQGDVFEFGSVTAEEQEMIAFAKRYDPQVFHVDPAGAAKTPFGGLIASGWYTAALASRMVVEQYLPGAASLGSPGLNELRWLKPVRPGTVLSLRVRILEARQSASKPDRGLVRGLFEVLDQDREAVMTWEGINIMLRREFP